MEIAPIVPVEEVTLDSSKKQPNGSNKWCFTHKIENIKSEDDLIIKKIVPIFKQITKFYIFSVEIGESGYRHLQGYIETKSKIRLTACKKLIDDTTHWEKAKGSRESNIAYCSKDPIKGPFSSENKHLYTAEELDLITQDMLYDWQNDLIEIINRKPLKRAVRWYWSKGGGLGKTEFTKYLMYHYNAKFCQGAKKDIMCSILGKDGSTKARPIYIFGFPRTVEDKVSYDAIESVIDGCLFSSKYESSDALIPIPHVICFANFPPKRSTMSSDRWIVTCLDKDQAEDPLSEIEVDHYEWD